MFLYDGAIIIYLFKKALVIAGNSAEIEPFFKLYNHISPRLAAFGLFRSRRDKGKYIIDNVYQNQHSMLVLRKVVMSMIEFVFVTENLA